jgi:5'-3' exoribonuclease 1
MCLEDRETQLVAEYGLAPLPTPDINLYQQPALVQARALQLASVANKHQVYIDWPYHHEAIVDAVITQHCEVSGIAGDLKVVEFKPQDFVRWTRLVMDIEAQYRMKKALDVGTILFVLRVRRMIGLKRSAQNLIEPIYSHVDEYYPLNAVVTTLPNPDARYAFQTSQSTSSSASASPPAIVQGMPVLLKTKQYYGCLGTVSRIAKKITVQIDVASQAQPNLADILGGHYATATQYFPLYIVARRLRMSPKLLSRFSASYRINNREIGLRLKFTKGEKQVLGYTQRVDNQWNFSEKAIELMQSYVVVVVVVAGGGGGGGGDGGLIPRVIIMYLTQLLLLSSSSL